MISPSPLAIEEELVRMERELANPAKAQDITGTLGPILREIGHWQDVRIAATFERPIRYTV